MGGGEGGIFIVCSFRSSVTDTDAVIGKRLDIPCQGCLRLQNHSMCFNRDGTLALHPSL